MKIQLNDRTLWFDGTSQVDPDVVPTLLMHGVPPDKISVNFKNEDISKFNESSNQEISTSKLKNDAFDLSYNIPLEFLQLDLQAYIEICLTDIKTDNISAYQARVDEELNEIRLRGMETLVKTLIFLIHRLRENNIVWGLGRGSSCASLVLFLIGLHEIDPIKYNIPLTEFFHS